MKRRILSLIPILLILVALLTLFAGAETGVVGEDFWSDPSNSKALLVGITLVLGVGLSALPVVVSLVKIFDKKNKYPLPYYVMFAASAAWMVMSIVIIILTLV